MSIKYSKRWKKRIENGLKSTKFIQIRANNDQIRLQEPEKVKELSKTGSENAKSEKNYVKNTGLESCRLKNPFIPTSKVDPRVL